MTLDVDTNWGLHPWKMHGSSFHTSTQFVEKGTAVVANQYRFARKNTLISEFSVGSTINLYTLDFNLNKYAAYATAALKGSAAIARPPSAAQLAA